MARPRRETARRPASIPGPTLFDMLSAIEGLFLEVHHITQSECMCDGCGVYAARIRHFSSSAAVIAKFCPICLANWEYAVTE